MDEIIAAVSQRTGLPPDKARAAVEAVVEHLKGRLPAGIASHLDGILASGSTSGATASSGGLGGLAGELGGLFGKK
jgi:hypothetical protein